MVMTWTTPQICCLSCRRTFARVGHFYCHRCIIDADRWDGDFPKVNLRLTEDDVFSRGTAPAILQTRATQRYLRKRDERGWRACLRAKACKRANNAKRHGWKPTNDIRHIGDNQI